MLALVQKQRVRSLSWALVAIGSFTPFSPGFQSRATTTRRFSNSFLAPQTRLESTCSESGLALTMVGPWGLELETSTASKTRPETHRHARQSTKLHRKIRLR